MPEQFSKGTLREKNCVRMKNVENKQSRLTVLHWSEIVKDLIK